MFLAKNFILTITFAVKVIELSYFTCVFLVVRPFLWYKGQGHLSRSRFFKKMYGGGGGGGGGHYCLKTQLVGYERVKKWKFEKMMIVRK